MAKTMTSRDRTSLTLEHRPADRIPIHFWATTTVVQRLETALGAPYGTILDDYGARHDAAVEYHGATVFQDLFLALFVHDRFPVQHQLEQGFRIPGHRTQESDRGLVSEIVLDRVAVGLWTAGMGEDTGGAVVVRRTVGNHLPAGHHAIPGVFLLLVEVLVRHQAVVGDLLAAIPPDFRSQAGNASYAQRPMRLCCWEGI